MQADPCVFRNIELFEGVIAGFVDNRFSGHRRPVWRYVSNSGLRSPVGDDMIFRKPGGESHLRTLEGNNRNSTNDSPEKSRNSAFTAGTSTTFAIDRPRKNNPLHRVTQPPDLPPAAQAHKLTLNFY